MKKTLQLLLIFSFIASVGKAQLPDGSIAPNFVANDINGVEHNLYDVLASGKDVIIDFSATWCPPCWSFHETHTLNDLYAQTGPDGDNTAMVFYVECDVTTTMQDLQGLTTATQGDWITGTDYPIIDNSGIANAFQIGSYPTILKICQDRKIKNVNRITVPQYVEEMDICPSVEYASEPFFFADKYNGCGALEVQFTDDSWPRPTAWEWDFGDGNTSDEQSPSHTYEEEGDFAVTLKVTNDFGGNEETKDNLITIGVGGELASANVGPLTKDIGGGRYFEGGHQALIFDVTTPIMINSVKVFSDKDEVRTVVLLDAEGNLLNIKNVDVPTGESRIDIDFFVDAGTGFQLGLRSDAFLFRNDSGVQYPYVIDDLMTIRTSTAGTTPDQYYYYFYDWSVREAGCDPALNVEDDLINTLKVFPNPVFDQLIVEGASQDDVIIVTDVLGKRLDVNINAKSDQIMVDVGLLQTGMYLISVGDKVKKFYKE